jgi:hypothetical protein
VKKESDKGQKESEWGNFGGLNGINSVWKDWGLLDQNFNINGVVQLAEPTQDAKAGVASWRTENQPFKSNIGQACKWIKNNGRQKNSKTEVV